MNQEIETKTIKQNGGLTLLEHIHKNGDRLSNVIWYLWYWKLATLANLKDNFYEGTTTNYAYRHIKKLQTKGFIKPAIDKTGRCLAWTLTNKGYDILSYRLPTLKEKGCASECYYHDILLNSFMYEGIRDYQGPHNIDIYTEQQLKKYDEGVYEDWVPYTSLRTPDGYWRFRHNGNTNIFAIEVELSRKTDSEYNYIGGIYDSLEKVTRVLWLVKTKHQELIMWTETILTVCEQLESADIKYHADASSSLFVNGFNFEMEDFDVTVEWGCIQKVRSIFNKYKPTEIKGHDPSKFEFKINGMCIDVMSYKSKSGIGPDSERHMVMFSGKYIWSKKPSFYLSRMSAIHPNRIDALKFFKKNRGNIDILQKL